MYKKNKVYITFHTTEDPKPLAKYGLEVTKCLDKTPCLFSIIHPQLPINMTTTPYSTVGIGGLNTVAPLHNIESLVRTTEQVLQDVKEELGSDSEVKVEIGFWEEMLLKESEKDAYLIVISKENEMNFMNEVFGTFESRIVENATVPVLIVPNNTSFKALNNIAYIVDFNEEHLEDLEKLAVFAERFNAKITLLTIAGEMTKEKNVSFLSTAHHLKNRMSRGQIEYGELDKDNVTQEVHDYIKNKRVDWLAFHEKDKNFLQRIFDQYNTERLILDTNIPVLVF